MAETEQPDSDTTAATVADRATLGGRRAQRSSQRGTARRRLSVFSELAFILACCVGGYLAFSMAMQKYEARLVVDIVRALSGAEVSAIDSPHLLVFPGPHQVLEVTVSSSCSSLPSILALAALTVALLRSQRGHAVLAFIGAATLVMAVNDMRMAVAVILGADYGRFWLLAFHDWAGTIWNFVSSLIGYLGMVCTALPSAERAEQDRYGRHTARRPLTWARPGLGYHVGAHRPKPQKRRNALVRLYYRYVLPKPFSRLLSRRREAGRIDYRIGHLSVEGRIEAVRALADDGLAVHTASLLAVATYDEDVAVLDALAGAVAAHQWEPVTSARVASLRLWARGWLANRPGGGTPLLAPGAPPAGADGDPDSSGLPVDGGGTPSHP